ESPNETRPCSAARSERCMNCRASDETRFVPGLVIKSVIAGPGGGSLTADRSGETGHGIPFDQRFGGWYVTGRHGISNHWGNVTGRMIAGEVTTIPNPPGARFSFEKYPVGTSDILPQLLHEHQAGFINRVVEASYRTRTALAETENGKFSTLQNRELREQAEIITRYLLFADEAPLPPSGFAGDPEFKVGFRRG